MKKSFHLIFLYVLCQVLVLAQENQNVNDDFAGESILLLAQQWYQQAQSFPANSKAAAQTAALARKRYIQFIALKPEIEALSKAQYELAQCYLIEQSPLLAKEYFLACISSGTDNEWTQQAIYEIAKIDEASFDFERALGWYEQLLKKSISPKLKILVLLKLAQYAQQQNNLEQATELYLDLLEQLKEQDTSNIAHISTQQAHILALTNLGQIYFRQAKNSSQELSLELFKQALSYYNQLLELELTPEQKYSTLFQKAAIGKNREDIDSYRSQLLAITEDTSLATWHEKTHLQLLVSYFDQGEDSVVLDSLTQLAQSSIISELASEFYWLGANAAQRQNQLELAAEYFDLLGQLQQDNSSSLNKIAVDYQDLLLSYQRNTNKKSNKLTKKIDRFLSEYQLETQNHYYQMAIWLKAEQLLSLEEYNQALFYYESINPEYLNPQYQSKYGAQLANIFIQAKAYDKAVSILTKTLSNPALSEAKIMESLIKRAACYESLKQDHLAIADYEQVFKYRSNIQLFAHAKYRLAEILANKSLPERSIDTYLSLLDQVPNLDDKQQAFIYSKLGYLYELTNDLTTAEKYYQQCLSLNIDSYIPLANQALMKIYFSQQSTTKLSQIIEDIWFYNQSIIEEKADRAHELESQAAQSAQTPIAQEAQTNELRTDATITTSESISEAIEPVQPAVIKKPITIPRPVLIWVATRHYIDKNYAQSALFLQNIYEESVFTESELLLYRYLATSEFETNDLDAAQMTIKHWLEQDLSSYEQAQAKLLQAKILYEQKQYSLAATQLEALIKQNPQGALLAQIQYELAKNYAQLEQRDKAIQYLILIIEFNTEISYIFKMQILTDLVQLLTETKQNKESTYYKNQLEQLTQSTNEK